MRSTSGRRDRKQRQRRNSGGGGIAWFCLRGGVSPEPSIDRVFAWPISGRRPREPQLPHPRDRKGYGLTVSGRRSAWGVGGERGGALIIIHIHIILCADQASEENGSSSSGSTDSGGDDDDTGTETPESLRAARECIDALVDVFIADPLAAAGPLFW